MNITEQYRVLEQEKVRINELLRQGGLSSVREILLSFVRPGELKRLFMKDNQLFMLNCFCNIWIDEQKKLPSVGIRQNIFEGIRSLQDVEEKYISVKFGVLRLETPMPKEYYTETVDYYMEHRISGLALHYMIKNETGKRERNIATLAGLLKERGEYGTAMILLGEGEKTFPGNKEILMELSDCWITGGQWERARECLRRIKRPGKTVRRLLQELESIPNDEKV